MDALHICDGKSRTDFEKDMITRRAMVHAVQELGEAAAARLSEAGRSLLPDLPWERIVRTRHILVP